MTEPLKLHRGLVLSRALIAGAAGLVPIPYVDDLLAGAVRSQLVRQIARLRNVDLDANAVDALATPRGSRLLGAASFGAAALGTTRRAFRRVAASLLIVRRADEAVQTFQVGTLFDYYCARHHVGFGLDGARAAEVRAAMDRAIKAARSEAAEKAFRRVLRGLAALALKVPRGLWSLWSERRGQPLRPEHVPDDLEERLERAASSNFVRRAVDGLDAELRRGYLDALTAAFDAAWQPPAEPKP
ncbi:MAG TPA: hypothetical protein VFF06_22635 [Polyangia bacterium]|nr:hypothetical protein [Polyangia bacterium]